MSIAELMTDLQQAEVELQMARQQVQIWSENASKAQGKIEYLQGKLAVREEAEKQHQASESAEVEPTADDAAPDLRLLDEATG